ncbi:thiol-disulfide oxidoreductase DCC family protein [Chitinolyticbacter albus]|uniref:thiol-disulfide oxidoreductase DCC family protein n=1 Tax=Chitinolyticbacter albus TaxID=2961951 RepID=UPI002108DC30|nr:DCC1-like thiol-disulfide oxidoreductase family protein [Chitinolyticbacter albus]
MTTIYFDSRYLLCRLEVGLLRRLAASRAVAWQDLNAAGFDAAALGLADKAMRSALHLRNDSGWVIGADAVRAMYRACGLTTLARLTELGPVRRPADAAYRLFARCHAR